jgi:thiamine-phosphate pyrophosphorylase
MKPLSRLYAIADASFGDPVRLAESLFNGGAQLVQVRNKNGSARELLEQVERILKLAPPEAQIIVNDRVDVALIAGAAGVHLGQTDLPPAEARRILGDERVIGFSTHHLQQLIEANDFPVDYVALGPIFPTVTKENPDPVVGIRQLAEACKMSRKPVVAIGGIQLERAQEVLNAGVASIAVIRDVLDTPNIVSRVQQWIEVLAKGSDRPLF